MDKLVMVVDDSATIRRAVELLFRATQYTVEAVGSAGEALSRLDAITPSIFLIEASLQGVDGFELCRKLKERESTADTPILLMVSADNPDVARVEEAEVDGYVLKPFGANELLDPVWMLLGESPTRDSPLTFGQQLEARRLEQQQAEARRLEQQRAAAGILAPPKSEAQSSSAARASSAGPAGDDFFDESQWVREDDSDRRGAKKREDKRAKEKDRAAGRPSSSTARASGAAAAADLDDFGPRSTDVASSPPSRQTDLPVPRPPNPSSVGAPRPTVPPPSLAARGAQPSFAPAAGQEEDDRTVAMPSKALAEARARSATDEPVFFEDSAVGSRGPVPPADDEPLSISEPRVTAPRAASAPAAPAHAAFGGGGFEAEPFEPVDAAEPDSEGETVADTSGQIAQAAAALALQRSDPPEHLDHRPVVGMPSPGMHEMPSLPPDEAPMEPPDEAAWNRPGRASESLPSEPMAPSLPSADQSMEPPRDRSGAEDEIRSYLTDRRPGGELDGGREGGGDGEIIERASGATAANDDDGEAAEIEERGASLQPLSTLSPSYRPPPTPPPGPPPARSGKRESGVRRSKGGPSPYLIVALLILVAAGVLFALSLTQK